MIWVTIMIFMMDVTSNDTRQKVFFWVWEFSWMGFCGRSFSAPFFVTCSARIRGLITRRHLQSKMFEVLLVTIICICLLARFHKPQ